MAYYSQAAQHVKQEIFKEIDKDEIRWLHKIQPWKHYNLARVHKLLKSFYARGGMKAYGYGELFFRYVILNERPHSDWEPQPDARTQPPLAAAAL